MKPKTFEAWYRDFPETFAAFKPSKPTAQKVCYRFMELDHTRAVEDQRTIEAVLSTETPVQRAGFREVLSHSSDAIDLERATGGKLPLLWGHDQNVQIGVAENVRLLNGKLRACLRFSKSARGEEVWQDVREGIASGISIGYRIEEYSETDTGDDNALVVTATRWAPFESSVVACPADLSAGIGRALESGSVYDVPQELAALQRQNKLYERYQYMLEREPGIVDADFMREQLTDVQTRIMAAVTQKETDDCVDLIKDAHVKYWAAQDTGEEVRGIRTGIDHGNDKPHNYNSRGNTMQDFNLCRAIAMQFDPASMKAGGHEIEIMQQTAQRAGKRSQGGSYTLPESEIFRAVTKGGTGGNLIGTQHMSNDFVPALRNRLITGRLGATVLTGLTGDIQIPKQLSDSSAGWIAGDGSDQVGASDPTYGKITMSPVTVGVKTTMSRKMLIQGDPASEMLLRNSLAFAVAKAIDTAALTGDGTSNVPTGILETSGIGTGTYTALSNLMFSHVVDMEGDLMIEDADIGNMGYLTTGAVAAKLKQNPIVPTGENMIWTSRGEGEGLMNGYRAVVSNIVPTGHVLFGNWSDLVIGMWSGLDFTVDPYTRAAYGDIVITLLVDCDIAVRHAESFSELHEAP